MLLAGSPVNLSASGAVSNVPGVLLGVLVNSSTSGTFQLKDGGSNGTAVTGVTAAIGTAPQFIPCYIAFSSSCYAVIGGTLNATFVFQFNA